MLALGETFPVPRHLVKSRGEKWAEPSGFVSNGAFTLEVGEDGESWVLRRNPGYGGRFRGNVERVEITLLKERTEGVWNPTPQIMALYDADQNDFAAPFSPGAHTARQRHAQEEVSWPAMLSFGLVLNCRRAPFNDPRVRRALGLGMDRGMLVELAWGEEAIPASGGLVPPGIPGHSPGIGLGFDPEAARHLLGEAGFAGGEHLPSITFLHPMNQACHAIARNLTEQWQKTLGIRIQGRPLPYSAYTERVQAGEYDLALEGWMADYPDPDSFLRVYVSSHASLEWSDGYAQLVREAARMHDQRTRLEMYARADRLICQQAVYIPLVYGTGRAFIKPWIRRERKWYSRGFWKDVIIDPH